MCMRVLLAFLLLAAAADAHGQTWTALGPPGGDVRALASDPAKPSHVFLGGADGHIFGSEDSGAHWTLLGRASSHTDAVITAIVVDPRDSNVLFASSWTRNSADGGIFRSADGGRTWSEAGLSGQSVRALVMAPSDPRVLVAGTLDGVYRSVDASKTWDRISPEHDPELRNLDSLAVDPRDPQIIYAGTFHLPWKTSDGGRSWHPVHDGMIDDSDVMSLLIDQGNSQRIFASACSGIYRSDDGGAQWSKIQGIPYAARRTYALAQDPRQPDRVYAGTSEGLWLTSDGGLNWSRATAESLVINAVVITDGSPGRVLIGTEKLGILASDDGGAHFHEANAGFDHRQILALGRDGHYPARVLALLAHAPEPVLATGSENGAWSALGPGLRAEQPLYIYATPDGEWWTSLVGGGLMRYDEGSRAWKPAGILRVEPPDAKGATRSPGGRAGNGPRRSAPRQSAHAGSPSSGHAGNGASPLLGVVTDMAFNSKEWYAATDHGLLVSFDRGAVWRRETAGPVASLPVHSVRVSGDGQRIRVVCYRGLVFSDDGGRSWTWHDLPLDSGGADALDFLPGDDNTLIATARNGLYISCDAGQTWNHAASGLPATPVASFAASGGVWAAAMSTGGLFISSDSGRTWARIPGVVEDEVFSAIAPGEGPGIFLVASATEGLYRLHWSGDAASGAAPAGNVRSENSGGPVNSQD